MPLPAASALQALYEVTDGAAWSRNFGWNMSLTNVPPCAWHRNDTSADGSVFGLTCNDADEILQLNLAKTGAVGTLPTEVALLAHLQSMTITSLSPTAHAYGRALSGTLPTELALLTQLQWLQISGSSLSGTLPTGLVSLDTLSDGLALSENKISGTVPSQLGLLTGVTSWLTFYGNSLSGTLPTEMGKLTAVQHLMVGFQPLSGTMPSEMGLLTALSDFEFYGTAMSGTLPSELMQLKMVSLLNWGGSSMSGTLPTELGLMTNAEGISLEDAAFSGTIPSQIGSMPFITAGIQLENNQLSGVIPSELGLLRLNQFLVLGNNRLSGTIPTALFNERGGKDGEIFGGFYDDMYSLELHNNRLSGAIPTQIGKFSNLGICILSDAQCYSMKGDGTHGCNKDSSPVANGGMPGLRALLQATGGGLTGGNEFACPLPSVLPSECTRNGAPQVCVDHTRAIFVRNLCLALIVLVLCCIAILCFPARRRRWWWHAVRRRLSRAFLANVEMVASSTKESLASQDACMGILSEAPDAAMQYPPEEQPGHQGSAGVAGRGSGGGEGGGALASPHGTDTDRLLHMVKGLAGSALSASQVVGQHLNNSSMTASDQRRALALTGSATDALSEAIEYLVSRQVFADLERGRYLTRKVDGDMHQLLQSVLHEGGEGIVEVTGGADDPFGRLRLMLDVVLLRMVLNEAVGNSRKYRAPGTPIRLSARFEPRRLPTAAPQAAAAHEAAVAARGRGSDAAGTLHVLVENRNQSGSRRLTDEECVAVFERGVRGPNATATSTGLGLDTAKKAADAGGGTVRLSTRADASDPSIVYTAMHVEMPAERAVLGGNLLAWGSTARVGLPASTTTTTAPLNSSSTATPPLSTPSPTAPSSASSAAGSLSDEPPIAAASMPRLPEGLSILVADDLSVNRFILSHHLASICPGSTICEAASGGEVLELSTTHTASSERRPMGFDVFFVDEDMGDGLTGGEVISRLHQRRAALLLSASSEPSSQSSRPPPTILFVSVTAGGGTEDVRQRLLAAGADLVWNKPLPSELEMAHMLHAKFASASRRLGSAAASGSLTSGNAGSE